MSAFPILNSDAGEVRLDRVLLVHDANDERIGYGRIVGRTRGLVPGTLEGYGVEFKDGSRRYWPKESLRLYARTTAK